jgi:hypothetical protein
MTSETLSSVMLDVLKNNRRVGKILVDAYRVKSTQFVEKNLSGKFGDRGQKVGDFLIKGIDTAADSGAGALVKVCEQASSAIRKIVDNAYATKYFDLVGKIALPGAKIARNLSGKLADRLGKLDRSAGTKARTRSGRKTVKHRRAQRSAAAR